MANANASEGKVIISTCKKCKGSNGEPVVRRTDSKLMSFIQCPCGEKGNEGLFTIDVIADWNRKNK